MKKFFILAMLTLFFSTNLFAEFRMVPVVCNEKKISNCGAYLYDSETGATYFCDSEKCNQVMEVMNASDALSTEKEKKSFKSKIPKFKKSN
jgi:hypothetical protein